jgi:hypothetical protein
MEQQTERIACASCLLSGLINELLYKNKMINVRSSKDGYVIKNTFFSLFKKKNKKKQNKMIAPF